MNLPIYKIVLGDTEGIEKMSLVEYPAVERNFLAFSKDEKPLKFSIQDEYQHIVMGCALRANYPIYRNQNGFEFYVVFTPEDINTLYQKFMIDERINDVNLEHSKDVNGVHLIQSFIKNTETGINPIGFEDCENGSWFVAYKIDNEDIWKEVLNGTFKGFSIEGEFELHKIDPIDALIDELINKI